MERKTLFLGDILLENGMITQEQLENALKQQQITKRKLGATLIELGYINANQLVGALDEQFENSRVELSKIFISPEVPLMISEKMARHHNVIPIKLENGVLTLAMEDALNLFAIDDVKLATGLPVKAVSAPKDEILRAIGIYYEKKSAERALAVLNESFTEDYVGDIDVALQANVDAAPVVKLLNSLIRQAVQMRASDIHIEPLEKIIRIRFRLDGNLQEIMEIEKTSYSAITTRIKIMSSMDIAERRVPQDGRIEITVDGRTVDMRISAMPTVYGEKIVMRLLDRSAVIINKNQLGFSEKNLKIFDEIIQNPHGIILVSGPTGSGKTTTLYTIMKELNTSNVNIITVEDPVEYRLAGINQSQVNTKAGLTFASGLRSILRQDPDIIMIGEIRDDETAQIAVRAAITGHLVLSTIHTNDAVSTISRLIDMGVEPFMVSNSMVGVIAQRLVKKICTNCKEAYEASPGERLLLGVESEHLMIYKGRGCVICENTGYKGRTAIHEILPIREQIKEAIDLSSPMAVVKQKAMEAGMTTLRDSCRELVLNGITSVGELLRTTFSLD